MKNQNNKLLIRQLDKKLSAFRPMETTMPETGWLRLIRKTLNMSLQQLSTRMSITPQSVRSIETREKEGTITLNALKEAASALNMRLVYGFVPNDRSLEKIVEEKARERAQEIVMRTSTTMKLEDQENSQERIKQAIEDLADELQREIPKSLWD
jgi:predicted DNA-binding mobile mystery protein A